MLLLVRSLGSSALSGSPIDRPAMGPIVAVSQGVWKFQQSKVPAFLGIQIQAIFSTCSLFGTTSKPVHVNQYCDSRLYFFSAGQQCTQTPSV